MKRIKLYGTDIEVKANNQREEWLLRIINTRLETMSTEYCFDHMVAEMRGMMSSLYFLRMTDDPVIFDGFDKHLVIKCKNQRVSLPMADAA